MSLPTKIVLLIGYVVAVVSTVYLWDNRRRRDLYKSFMPAWQLEMNMVLFPFLAPIALFLYGLVIFSLLRP